MQKKGAGRIFNSKDGKLGLPLLVSIILVFALTIVFTEAMVVRLQTPGNFTYGIGCLNFTNSTPATALTFSGNFTVFIDASPPGFNFSELNVSIYNTSVVAQRVIQFKLNDSGLGINLSYNGSINMSIFLGGTKVAFFNYTNSSAATNLTCSAMSPP